MPEITPIIALFGVFASATVGFFARGLFVAAEVRNAVDATYRKIEDAQRAHGIKDPRNDTRAF